MSQLQQMWLTDEAKNHEDRKFRKGIARQICQEKWIKAPDVTSEVAKSYWYQWAKLSAMMIWVCDNIAEFYGMWLWELDHTDAQERFGISDTAYHTLIQRSDRKKQVGAYLMKKWWVDPQTKERKYDTLWDNDKQNPLKITSQQADQWLQKNIENQ